MSSVSYRYTTGFFLFLLGLSIGPSEAVARRKTEKVVAPQPTTPVKKEEGLFDNLTKEKNISIILGVMDLILRNYVDVVEPKKLLMGTLNGMLGNLDPHSRYCSPEDFAELCTKTKGEFGGLGMEVTMENGIVKIISPIDSTPAAEAGLKGQDLILAIDNVPLSGLSLFEAVKKMRGAPGTTITLLIKRDGVAKPFPVTLTRAIIQVKSVKWHIENGDVGYLRIATFDEKIADLLAQAIKDIKEKLGNKLKGFVIDVRDNPGGRLDKAIAAVNLFVDRGVIVSTKGRKSDHEAIFKAEPNKMLVDGVPIVVLINGGSASASEILAGALKDHKKALIMGEPSFGKGSVQTLIPLGQDGKDGGITLTIARFYTPSGITIQGKGITPDVLVEQMRGLKEDPSPLQISEKILPGSISGVVGQPKTDEAPTPKPDTKGDKGTDKKTDTKAIDLKPSSESKTAEGEIKDYQLLRAVETVIALYIYKQSLGEPVKESPRESVKGQ